MTNTERLDLALRELAEARASGDAKAIDAALSRVDAITDVIEKGEGRVPSRSMKIIAALSIAAALAIAVSVIVWAPHCPAGTDIRIGSVMKLAGC